MIIDPKKLSYHGYDPVRKRDMVKEEVNDTTYIIHLFRNRYDANDFIESGLKVGP